METILFNAIIAILAILVSFVIKWVNAKANAIKANSNNVIIHKYTDMVSQTIIDCVIATNQTYVNTLKTQGKFDEKAQKIAFQKTMEAVLATLTEDAKIYLTNIYGDLNIYLTSKIEAEVNRNK